MPRLATALIAAMGLHVLLLMSLLPEQHVVEPEIKGSGMVTVSIVRSSPPVTEAVAGPVEEPITVEQVEKQQVQVQEVVEKPLLVPEIQPAVPRTVRDRKKVPVQPVPAILEEQKNTSPVKSVVSPATHETEPAAATAAVDEPFALPEQETLRSPEPIEHLNLPPAYPSLARKRGWQGTVLLEVDVQSNGMVESIQIKKSSSYELLDKKAFEAVAKWRFSPGLKDGIPVSMKVLVPVHFLLQEN